MRVHIKNIVANAISRGLIDGFDTVRKDLRCKKLTEDEEIAVLGKIGLAIWRELDDMIDFSDEDDELPTKVSKTPMGFAAQVPEPIHTDAVSSEMLPSDDDIEEDEDDADDDTNDMWSLRRSVEYRKRLETLLYSRPRRS